VNTVHCAVLTLQLPNDGYPLHCGLVLPDLWPYQILGSPRWRGLRGWRKGLENFYGYEIMEIGYGWGTSMETSWDGKHSRIGWTFTMLLSSPVPTILLSLCF